VIFYDSDFNPQMDRQCEDRAHRIGQIRDVHIYRFVSKHTVEEALLRKANQKRSLDAVVIQRGEFDWRTIFGNHDSAALDDALGALDDAEDAQAARAALREAVEVEGADNADFESGEPGTVAPKSSSNQAPILMDGDEEARGVADPAEEEEGGTIVEYMLQYIVRDEESEYFSDWF
jgi:helicase SWR1